jgi:hypothetical protein
MRTACSRGQAPDEAAAPGPLSESGGSGFRSGVIAGLGAASWTAHALVRRASVGCRCDSRALRRQTDGELRLRAVPATM